MQLSCLFLLLLPGLLPASAQMETPLKGQGAPVQETTEVYLSCYLDRLLEGMDDVRSYRFSAVLYFYLTWRDPTAYDTVQRSAQRMREGGYTCQRPCTDWVTNLSCCDGIYQPTFFFRNAHGFPQDRATGYKLYALAPPNGSVLWTQYVQASFYQPMDLRHYPFDSFDLHARLEFLDTSPPEHPGVEVRLSSGGPQLYTYGRGDATSQWGMDSLTVEVLPPVDSVAWFKNYSAIPSNPEDPLGLTTSDAARLRGSPPGATSTQDANPVTMVVIKIRIYRFWRSAVFNSVLPVVLLGLLAFFIFFLERKDLSNRLTVLVTLFLAMAAVQFVIQTWQPLSSYIMPTQQLVVATYLLLVLMAVESIAVHYIETYKERAEAAARRRQARDRFLAACKAGARASAAAARQDNLPTKQPPAAFAAPPAGACPEHYAAAPQCGGSVGCQASGGSGQAGAAGATAAAGAGTAAAERRRLTRVDSLSQDAAFDEYCAWLLDRTAMWVLLVGYIVTSVLIFTLSSGYIDLFT